MQDVETYRRAVLEYSQLAPRIVVGSLAVVTGQTRYDFPVDCIGILDFEWGDQAELLETLTNTTSTQVWAVQGQQLVLSPTPTEDSSLRLVYQANHQFNELDEERPVPTAPRNHLPYIDDLEQALQLELQADEVAGGPTVYMVGQTQVSRADALKDLRERAATLRRNVTAKLDSPLALWM